MGADECGVTACTRVLLHRDDEKRRRVSRGEAIWESGEPRHQARRLRDFVLDLAIGALKFHEELQRGAHVREVANAVQRQRCPL